MVVEVTEGAGSVDPPPGDITSLELQFRREVNYLFISLTCTQVFVYTQEEASHDLYLFLTDGRWTTGRLRKCRGLAD